MLRSHMKEFISQNFRISLKFDHIEGKILYPSFSLFTSHNCIISRVCQKFTPSVVDHSNYSLLWPMIHHFWQVLGQNLEVIGFKCVTLKYEDYVEFSKYIILCMPNKYFLLLLSSINCLLDLAFNIASLDPLLNFVYYFCSRTFTPKDTSKSQQIAVLAYRGSSACTNFGPEKRSCKPNSCYV